MIIYIIRFIKNRALNSLSLIRSYAGLVNGYISAADIKDASLILKCFLDALLQASSVSNCCGRLAVVPELSPLHNIVSFGYLLADLSAWRVFPLCGLF